MLFLRGAVTLTLFLINWISDGEASMVKLSANNGMKLQNNSKLVDFNLQYLRTSDADRVFESWKRYTHTLPHSVERYLDSLPPVVTFMDRVVDNSNSSESFRISTTDLYGGIVKVGEYYTTLSIASQKVNVQIDTGSSTLAVPLRQCSNCREGDHRIDLSLSSHEDDRMIPCASDMCGRDTCDLAACGSCSFSNACCSTNNPQKCSFFLRYADGSGAQGALVQSFVSIGDKEVYATFGGILQDSASFERKSVDGILGLAYPSLACNPTCISPLFDRLVKENLVEDDVFSICTRTVGGKLVLGGVDHSMYEGQIEWVPLMNVSTRRYYDVHISGLKVGDSKIQLPHFHHAIVDSGTTLIVLTLESFNALKAYFQKHYCEVPGLCPSEETNGASWFDPRFCATLTRAQLRKLPSLSFIFSDTGPVLTLNSEEYMLEMVKNSTGKKYRCLGIHYLKHLERLGNDIIIGNTLLQKYFTVYDRTNLRVGFAQSAPNCKRKLEAKPPSLASSGGNNSLEENRKPEKNFQTAGMIVAVCILITGVFAFLISMVSITQPGLVGDRERISNINEYELVPVLQEQDFQEVQDSEE